MTIKDSIYSIIYRILRSEAPNNYNYCLGCKKYRKNWTDKLFKKDYLIGFDKILYEWVVFSEHNFYAKTWVMNKYITKLFHLTEPLWNDINGLCRRCITKYLNNYMEVDSEKNEL